MNKKEKGNILIVIVFGFLIALLIGIIILWSKSPYNVEKQIIKGIEEDQEAQNKVVLLYSTPIKMNENTKFYWLEDYFIDKEEWNELSKNCDFYFTVIMNSEDEWIAYVIKVEKGKVTYCEEIE